MKWKKWDAVSDLPEGIAWAIVEETPGFWNKGTVIAVFDTEKQARKELRSLSPVTAWVKKVPGLVERNQTLVFLGTDVKNGKVRLFDGSIEIALV